MIAVARLAIGWRLVERDQVRASRAELTSPVPGAGAHLHQRPEFAERVHQVRVGDDKRIALSQLQSCGAGI